MKRRLPHVLGFRMPIERPHVKFKMGQDEPLADTQAATSKLAEELDPALAELMRRENAGRK